MRERTHRKRFAGKRPTVGSGTPRYCGLEAPGDQGWSRRQGCQAYPDDIGTCGVGLIRMSTSTLPAGLTRHRGGRRRSAEWRVRQSCQSLSCRPVRGRTATAACITSSALIRRLRPCRREANSPRLDFKHSGCFNAAYSPFDGPYNLAHHGIPPTNIVRVEEAKNASGGAAPCIECIRIRVGLPPVVRGTDIGDKSL